MLCDSRSSLTYHSLASSTVISTSGQARSVAASGSVAVVATSSGLDVISGSPPQKKSSSLSFDATAVALHSSVVAVGGEDGKVRVGQLEAGGAFKETALFENGRRGVSALNFSPDGKLLAAGEAGGRIMVYDVAEKKVSWLPLTHTTRIHGAHTAHSPRTAPAQPMGQSHSQDHVRRLLA